MANLPPSPFTALQLKAQKILRAAARAMPAQVMASPPTFIGPTCGVSALSTAPVAGGTGWVVGDLFTVAGGTLAGGGVVATGQVTAQSGGVATAVKVVKPGQYTTGGVPTGTLTATKVSGSGAGLTVNVSAGSGSPVAPGRQSFNNAQAIPVSDARLSDLSGIMANSGDGMVNQTGQYISRTLGSAVFNGAGGGNTFGFGKGFATDSQTVDVVCAAASGTANFILYVTDLATGIRWRAAASDYAITSTTQWPYFIDFGSKAPRYLEFFFGRDVIVRGFDVELTAGAWKYQRAEEPRMIALCDSYGEGQGATNRVRGSYVYAMGERLGCPGIVSNSIGGTGIFNDNIANNNKFGQRIGYGNLNAGFIGAMDLVYLPASINDSVSVNGAWTDAAFQAAWTAHVQSVMAAQPGAIIVCAGEQNPAGVSPQSRFDAIKAAVLAAASGNPRVLYVDDAPNADPIQTGTGKTTAPSGSGTNDIYVGSDGTHPAGDAGHAFYAERRANQIIQAVRGISGL